MSNRQGKSPFALVASVVGVALMTEVAAARPQSQRQVPTGPPRPRPRSRSRRRKSRHRLLSWSPIRAALLSPVWT